MPRFSRSRALELLVPLAFGLVACNDPDKPPFVPRDVGVQRDSGSSFLSFCQQDSDCASKRCLPMGPNKRCSQLCDAAKPCPALGGWSCSPQSACVCSYKGPQPNVCDVDGDCDGVADKAKKVEVCNGEDDDCNGKIDDVFPDTPGAKLYYRDEDGDGYGDQNAPLWSCQPPAGYVENKGDCDDKRKDVNPAMVEVCGDDVDHDCDTQTWDSDVCGLLPIVVSDVTDPKSLSGVMKSCGTTAAVDPSLDLVEIVAKQDATRITFTLRLAGEPQLASCASYVLRFGSFSKVYDLVYVYRPGTVACGPALPELEAFSKGVKVSTGAKAAFSVGTPGYVSFTIPKAEYLVSLTTPSYYVKGCSNAKADAAKDLTDCSADSCETPVRRE